MNCPRCKTEVGPLTSPDAIVTCPGCGSRLMTRSAALRSQGGAGQLTRPGLPPQAPAPGPAPDASPGAGSGGSRTAVKVGQASLSGKSSGGAVRGGRKSAAADAVTLEALMREIKAVRETQQQILDALAGAGGAAVGNQTQLPEAMDPRGAQSLSAIRAPQRKSVVLVDDEPKTREAAMAELERADIPVRAFADGNKALAAIAEDKPDVIVLELAVKGDMGGKDLVNMIKATMEWVDIPVVLWTRENVSNQREARQIHGADEVVAKSLGAAALVARVINVFRR